MLLNSTVMGLKLLGGVFNSGVSVKGGIMLLYSLYYILTLNLEKKKHYAISLYYNNMLNLKEKKITVLYSYAKFEQT